MSLRIFAFGALVILLVSLSACGSPSPSLLETQWQFATITTGIAREFIQYPEDYVLVFHEDGTFNGKADCNVISGTYEMNGNGLILSIGPTTLAECGPDSLYEGFLGFLNNVESFELEDNSLTLLLSDGSTEMGFENGGPAD